jgi:hypothetical protein
MAEQL